MATVSIDLQAFDRLTAKAAENGLRSALGEGEKILKDDVLNRPGTGRQYGKHRASAPGEPPAPDTGSLRANTNADPNLREDGDDVVGRITSNSAQAEALERGTERIAARPFLGRLSTDHRQDLQRAFVEGAKE